MDLTNQPYDIPPSRLQSRVHSLGEERIKAEAEKYFQENWNFDSEKKMRGFFSIGMSKAYSLFFPMTLDDRVDMTNRMLHLSLLTDGKFHIFHFTNSPLWIALNIREYSSTVRSD